MSDSDETICNEDGDISEIEEQNSPSILASWYENDKERKEVSEEMKENDIGLKENRTNLLKFDVNDFYRGSGSPEFPLISRELKRKEHSTEPSVLNSDDNSKVIRGEHGFLDSSDGERREAEDLSTNLIETLHEPEDGMAKIKALLMTLETAMTALETEQNSGDDANVSFNESRLEDIKCQLALLQKALVEINHKNQEARKKIISTEGSRQLSEEKKRAILSLAKKQRNVLEVFKKYKNLVQRFKQVKHQNDNALQEKCLERERTSFSQTRIVKNTEFSMKNIEQPQNPEGSQVSLMSTETSAKTARALPAHQTGTCITFVEESHPAKINTLEQMATRSEKSLTTVDITKSIQQPSSGGNAVPGAKSKIIIVSSGVGGLISQNVANQSVASSSSGVSMEGRSARHIAIRPNQVTTSQSAKKHTTPTSLEVSLPTKSIPQMQSYLTLSSGPAIVHSALTCLTTATCTKTNPTVTCMHSANAKSVTRSAAQSQPRLSQCVQRLSQSRQNDHHTTKSGPTFIVTAARPNTVNAHPTNTISQSLTYSNVPSNSTKTTSQCVQRLSQNSQKTHHISLSDHFPATTIAKTNYPITPTNYPTNTNSQSNCIYPIVPPTTRETTSHYVQDPPQSIQKTHPTLSSGPFPTTTIANTNSTGTNYPTTINSLCCQSPSVPPTTRVTTLHYIPAQSRERVQREPHCATVGQCYKTTSNAANSLPNTNQGSSKQIAGTPVSLETLMKKGVVTPGRNVLTATAEGKLYCASLSEKGTIISAGGEGFTSPRSWVKAILGRKSKVKHDVAWKMVSYKGKTLLDFANESTAEPPKQKSAISSSSISTNVDPITIYRDQKSPNLINSAASLTALLKHSRVTRVEKEELVPSDDILTKDFWLKTEFELESLKGVLFGLEF